MIDSDVKVTRIATSGEPDGRRRRPDEFPFVDLTSRYGQEETEHKDHGTQRPRHAYHLWRRAGRPEEHSEEFWLAAKAEFDRMGDTPWVTEEAATARRSRNLLEENPASG